MFNEHKLVAAAFAITCAMTMRVSVCVGAQSDRPQRELLPQADFLRPVHITGEVNRSGTFPVIDAPTLAELLNMAGGLTADAGAAVILIHFSDHPPLTPLPRGALMQLVRGQTTGTARTTITRIALTAPDTRPNLEPQDVLFVPAKNER